MATVVKGEAFVVGMVLPTQTFKITPSAAEETANTLDVDLSRYFNKIYWVENVLIFDSGNNVATSDVNITFDGTTVTIADGSSYDLEATDTIILTVHGVPIA